MHEIEAGRRMSVGQNQGAKKDKGCGCSGGNCSPDLSRRDFLRISGLATAMAGIAGLAGAAEFTSATAAIKHSPHLIPADKRLSAAFLHSLRETGARTPWRGAELANPGMPVSGIGTGQLFVCGDGTLGQWEIFNDHQFLGVGPRNYAARTIPKPVQHGFALVVDEGGDRTVRMLDASGFSDVAFRGEYPVATITYADPASPVHVKSEVFSPFIPLNAKDSALPATIFLITLENKGKKTVSVQLASWLENPIAASAGQCGWPGRRRSNLYRSKVATFISHSVADAPRAKETKDREPIVFATFDDGRYGWAITGTAFGDKPATGTLPAQNRVDGFEGSGLVNSFVGGDKPTGRMLSPQFTISRRFINFLIGGGDNAEQVGMHLLIDGESVRQAKGRNSEHLDWQFWDVSEFEGRNAQIELIDNGTGPWGHVLADQITFADRARFGNDNQGLEQFPDTGTLVWKAFMPALDAEGARKVFDLLPDDLKRSICTDGALERDLSEKQTTGLVTWPAELAPGAKLKVPFVLAWHFPNTVKPNRDCGHEYAARFKDAEAVVNYVASNLDRLSNETLKWRDTWYNSTLPVWLLDRIMWSSSCLGTGTVQWWKNGRFWAWEGVLCCEGTCTHVWNYAHSLARMFPELERSARERQDLDAGFCDDGKVGFRGESKAYAADGQCGTVLKIWREHQMSPDSEFLKRNWAKTRKVIDYLITQDGNADGIIENSQPNTYDIDFFGANTFVGALYLAALRAGEEMAKEMGDQEYAQRLRKIFESGKRLSEEKLWNGEYFTQEVDLKKYPRNQYGPGCLSDQMFGQNWAHQTGLGYLYDPAKVRKALESVWKYNWAPDTQVYNRVYPPQRPFTDPNEAGLFICTWPGSKHLGDGVCYRDEVWTGIEHQVAANMIYEGLMDEGLATCKAVHDRYHPMKRNPYNEVECSDFYARAMASWGILLALSGYQYHGPHQQLSFAPRITPENFRCAFTTAEGWGTFAQKMSDKSGSWNIDLRYGSLPIRQLAFTGPGSDKPVVRVNGKSVAAKSTRKGKELTLEFETPLVLKEGDRLVVEG